MTRGSGLGAVAALALALGSRAEAEPIFLAKQYTRCTTCHFSPTGGGLLTPYGRSLSREEISTTGKSGASAAAGGEQAFLYGALGDSLGKLSLGLEARPAHLDVSFPGGGMTRDFFMNADLIAAYAVHGWTFYGEVGRQLRDDGSKLQSYEHWIAYDSERGFGVRAGRFLPAYGIRLADHTAFTRTPLGFDKYDQIYGLELSHRGGRHLAQIALGPGLADAVIEDDGRKAFTASGRFQLDTGARTTLVASGLFRGASRLEPKNGLAGLAFGIAPTKRLAIWTEADASFRAGTGGAPGYTLLNETAFEVYRGVWLKLSPQLRSEPGDTSAGVFRTELGLNLFPRTHWNVIVSYYHDRDRKSDLTAKTWLAQLHLYL